MNRAAHDFLDRARAGADASEFEILAALRATGDIEADTVIRVYRPAGTWGSLPSHFPPDPLLGLLACPKSLKRAYRESP